MPKRVTPDKNLMENGFLKNPIATAETPGTVSRNCEKKRAEDEDNMEAATIVAKATGRNFSFLEPKNQQKIKTADAVATNGELWEIKTNRTSTASAIDNSLRSSKGQSDNVILNIKSDIADDVLLGAVRNRLKRRNIQRLIIIKDGKVFEYTRDELLK